jgi:hypothetical protein
MVRVFNFFSFHFLHLFKQVLISNAEQAESLIAHAVIKRATAMTNTNSQSRWVLMWEFLNVSSSLKRHNSFVGGFVFLPVESLKYSNYTRGCLKYVVGSFA